MSIKSEDCRRTLDHKSDLFTMFFSQRNAYKQKHNTNYMYKGTVALELHKCNDNFGTTPRYRREKLKTLPQDTVGKRSL